MLEGTATFFCLEVVDAGKLFEFNASMGSNLVESVNRKAMDLAADSHGEVVSTLGENSVLLVAFPFASKCVEAASAINRHLLSQSWYPSRHLVRSAVVTGEVDGAIENQEFLASIAALAGLARAGQILVDEATRAVVRKNLNEGHGFLNLGLHHLEDTSRGQSLFQLLHPDLPGEFQLLPSLLEAASNLPTGGTAFVGRVQEIADVKEGFYHSRVVSLVGFGGVGKTRLAIQVATELLEDHYHGACYLDLTSVSDIQQVFRAMSSALSVSAHPDLSLEQAVLEHLRSREILLMFDNVDDALDELPGVINRVVELCPRVQILTTSRKGLNLDTAFRVTVMPMETPGTQQYGELEFGLIDSVSLFVSRARLIDDGFELNTYTAKLIGAICTRLDGIPLAIELAAAQTQQMALADIAQNLDDRFTLLKGRTRGKGTLDTALHWSYDRLPDGHKSVLRSLIPFAGDFTFESAIEMTAGEPLSDDQRSAVIRDLVSLAYVQFSDSKGRGYLRLLDTIREFVRESIQDKGEIAEYMNRHATVFFERSKVVLVEIFGENQARIMEELDRTYRNYLVALDWILGSPRDDRPQEFIRALYTYWFYRSMYDDGVRLTKEVLANMPPDPVMRGKLHVIAGTLCDGKGDHEESARHFRQAVKLAAMADDFAIGNGSPCFRRNESWSCRQV
jgi:predicted ATPase